MSKKMAARELGVIDMGVEPVRVLEGSLPDLGHYMPATSEIWLQAGMEPHKLAYTFMHELVHAIDFLFFGNRLDSLDNNDSNHHPLTAAIAAQLDLALKLNWPVFEVIYGRLASTPEKKLKKTKKRRNRRTGSRSKSRRTTTRSRRKA